ncbi:MAG: VOC family protein [Planctomycetes bacterium]|nr:VOC family protein [Planctomycetota bacterium]MCW8137196.1 VOC family protein [Planctomycetota bacterium]
MRAELSLTILYVADLARAATFYDAVFGFEKTVDVPVYVEYRLNDGARLGLMPQQNTRHFLGDALGAQRPVDGCPRAEIYLHVPDVRTVSARLAANGAVCTSPLARRDWGDQAAYFMDHDGYVLAVAQRA